MITLTTIGLLVFVVFSVFYKGNKPTWNYLWSSLCMVGAVYFIFSSVAQADWPQEEMRINYLLSQIESSDLKFIRNSEEHDPKEAVAHLRLKLSSAQNSMFSPPKDKWTAEMFIDKIASKSSISGKPYLIKLPDRLTLPAKDWLLKKLKEFPKAVKP